MIFDTGELALLGAAERSEKQAVSAARASLSRRSRDFVADHPIASVGAAAALASAAALVVKSPLGGNALKVPARLAMSGLLGALFQDG